MIDARQLLREVQAVREEATGWMSEEYLDWLKCMSNTIEALLEDKIEER